MSALVALELYEIYLYVLNEHRCAIARFLRFSSPGVANPYNSQVHRYCHVVTWWRLKLLRLLSVNNETTTSNKSSIQYNFGVLKLPGCLWFAVERTAELQRNKNNLIRISIQPMPLRNARYCSTLSSCVPICYYIWWIAICNNNK